MLDRRIAVVDTQRLHLDLLARSLAGEPGFDCVIHQLAGDRPDDLLGHDLHAVLFSVHHPGLDLVAHLTAVRSGHPEATLVVLAGYVDAVLAEATAAAGADAVLPTSTPLEVVLRALRGEAVSSTLSIDRDASAGERARSLGLTQRQHEVLRHLATGSSPTKIAEVLSIKVDTCRDHIRALHRHLGCTSTTEVVIVGARVGLLPELGRPLR